ENPVVAAPEQKLYVGGRFNKKKWLASAGLQYIGGLYTQVGEKPQQEDFVLANAQLQFSPLDWLGIWIKGENLFDQNYEINAGYPMPGANFMAGASIRF
ncbi:MAG: TonB-dependent receptor, partial [Bacteroidales bacterium]|nr:TonB-dependent receptor [Bacteroidales bacterium]